MGKQEIKKMPHPCPHTIEDPSGKNRVLADMLTDEGILRQCCTCGPGEYVRKICNEGDLTSTQCSMCPPGENPYDFAHQKTFCAFPANANPTQSQSSTLPSTIQDIATQQLTPANIDIDTSASTTTTTGYPTTAHELSYSTNSTVLQQSTNETKSEGQPPFTFSYEMHLFVYAFALISAVVVVGFLLQKAFRCWRRRRNTIANEDVEASLPDKEPLVDSVVFRQDSQSTPVLERNNAENEQPRDNRQSEIIEDSGRSDDELLFEEDSVQRDADGDKQTSRPFGAAPAGELQRNAHICAELNAVGHFFLHIGSHQSMFLNSGDVYKLGHYLKIGPTNLTDMDNKYKSETARFLYEVFQATRKEHDDGDLLDVLFAKLEKARFLKLAHELDNELKTKVPGYKSRIQSLPMNEVSHENDGTSEEALLNETESTYDESSRNNES